MSEMIERTARAAYERWIEPVRDLEPMWDDLPEDFKARLYDSQSAAIQAMRDPTPKMLKSTFHICTGESADPDGGIGFNIYMEEDHAKEAWHAMIDEALK